VSYIPADDGGLGPQPLPYPQYPPWDSNPDNTRSERAGSAVGLEGLEATDQI